MAFLRSISRPDVTPMVLGNGVYLRNPQLGDYEAWAELRERSRTFLTPWEPIWAPDDLTRTAYRRRLRRYQREIREDHAYPFFIFHEEDHVLLGGCTLSGVQRGVQQSCMLGYWAGECHAGRGYVTSAVRALIPFVFEELKLHRLQAACLPENERSRAVLRKCGFTEEGIARGYLRINGAWRDHAVFAILRDDPRK
ncbi:GNAT family protein [Parvibaculum sp.]|jgi:[ribosomal protein S5]-alanine N-acetyltransferase|uniref:GNAT family N-acetyltransferase n=1 Tax=Parvibaculum sp. TaxID=2024848 RepID=UPI000C40B22B|nr:GNAT family protein [Parvibaculum sp.]MAM95549.1 30S ribosomal protein S5 alanine N-acetyltransferase [Parvibaculum sp.]HCX66899.1 30S ribosomal protein S5 alanine N-acetyltransferase [Rhodobiaceae bacterium]